MSVLAKDVIVELVSLIIVCILTHYYLTQGEKGKKYYIRRIPGVDAMDEALERATEMGGCINFCVGDMAQLSGLYVSQTIAGFECLAYIAKHCARLRTKLICATIGRSGAGGDLVPVQTEIIREAYAEEGRSEDFNSQIVRYLAGDRQGYETAIYDLYVNEKVTTNIFLGAWAGGMPQPTIIAKALGIVQISGTARTVQMAMQSCVADYFLIGEELFAAGAILSQDPAALSSTKMSDIVKYGLLVLLVVGNIVIWAGSDIVKTILNR